MKNSNVYKGNKLIKVAFVIEKLFQNNILFDKNQKKIFARDNVFEKYHILHDIFNQNGYEIATNDINTIENSDIVIYNDVPKKLPYDRDIYKSYLIMNESPLVRPDNFDIKKHKYFNKIFTWNDDLVDNKKYFKFNYSFLIPNEIPKKLNKEKLCCLIVGNKNSDYPNELYSERKKLIRWFEKNHINDFDLYGVGWNEYFFKGPKLLRALNRIPLAKKIMFNYFGDFYPSYQGKVDNKFNTMQEYKFAIAYENIKDQNGYITEKIFDCFFSGCIPVYLGANNITNYIPKECFIDKRDFKTYEELYIYISQMKKEKYLSYLDSIENFLNSPMANQFKAEFFAKIILKQVTRRE